MIRQKVLGIAFISLILFFSMGLDSCKKDTTLTPGPNEVFMLSTSFEPATITITQGETITWTNMDDADHTVTSNNGIFDSGSKSKGSTFVFTFPDKGTFNYYCIFHDGMTAKVIVQ